MDRAVDTQEQGALRRVHDDPPMAPLVAAAWIIVAAVLYSVCFPPARLTWLAWIALVPLFVAIRRTSLAAALWLTWMFTVLVAYLTGDWFPRAVSHYYEQPAAVGIAFFLGVSSIMAAPGTLAFALCYRGLARRRGQAFPLLVAAAWVGGELIRARLTGVPWVLLGYSQVDVPTMLQLADVTGIYGVAFVLVAVNAALAEWWCARRAGRVTRDAVVGLATAAAMALLALAYGRVRLAGAISPEGAGSVPVAIVQANLDLGSQWRQELYGKNLETYLELTLQEIRARRPPLIVWPENAMSFFLENEPQYRASLASVLAFGGAQLVAGGPRFEGLEGGPRYYNAAFLLAPDGGVLARYDKQRLLPFAEYFPFASLDFLHRSFGRVREFTPGVPAPPLPTVAGAAAVAICNESLFPEIVAERVRAGADYLINLSNDSWIPDATFSENTFNMVRARAVEQRRFIIRASTSGPSAVVDPFGRVMARGGVLERAVIAGAVRPLAVQTVYARIGDTFAALCVVSVAVALAWSLGRRPAPTRLPLAGGAAVPRPHEAA